MDSEKLQKASPSLLFFIVSSSSEESYYKIKKEAEGKFSKTLYESNPLPKWTSPFVKTGKFTKILSFQRKISREELPQIKQKTMEMKKGVKEDPSLEIIPGYLSPHNVVIGSAYDDFHKIYLFNGVYAEVVYQFIKQKMLYIDDTPEFFKNPDVIYYFSKLREAYVK